jgi:transposase
MERTAMSRKEFTRGTILEQVKGGTLSLAEATPLLGVSYRQAKRLWRRYRTAGAPSLVHGNVGRGSNRRHPAPERAHVVALIRAHYSGTAARGPGQRFGPTLVAEQLWEAHGLLVPRSTLRDWMQADGLWSRQRKASRAHPRRARREHFGELVQLDGSFHDWYEGRGDRAGRRSCLMSLVDDATSTTLVRLGDEETIWAAVRVLEAWIAAYGVPRALYTDWKTVYKCLPKSTEKACGVRVAEAHTHFGRMCQKLGIAIIGAASPQAKGRIERNHGTQQDRLIKKLRVQNVSDDAAANAYVEATYLPEHNTRFAVPPLSAVDYHLPRDPALSDDAVFCLEFPRVVGNDSVVQFRGRGLQLDRRARGRVPIKSAVVVCETEDGRLRIRHRSRDGQVHECAWTEAVPRAHPTPILPPLVPVSPTPAVPKTPWRPAADHPWRREIAQEVAVAQRKHARCTRRAPAAPPCIMTGTITSGLQEHQLLSPSPRGHFYPCKEGDISIRR